MSRNPGSSTTTSTTGAVPPAVRATSPGWRDPRLWVGVAIVAGSVLVGARVVGSADETVQVWAVAADAPAGERLGADDLEARRLRFADAGELDRYFEVGDELPADLTLARPVGSGELLPRAALGTVDDADTVTISLALDPLLVPSGVGPGSVVDVYVSGGGGVSDAPDVAGVGAGVPARSAGVPVLDDVRVVATPEGDDFGGGDRQVELAVPDADVAAFYELL
ncbi:MAG: hypothetical protein JWN84_1032, partial [Nocardioides sp.]|nr:hypothetical protein [Nocardioides sp.]